MATVTVSNDERDREKIVQERWWSERGDRVFSFSVAHAQSAFKSILIAMFTPRRHIARTLQDATAKRRLQLKIYLLPLLLLLLLFILLLLLLHLFVPFFQLPFLLYASKAEGVSSPAKSLLLLLRLPACCIQSLVHNKSIYIFSHHTQK